MDILQGVQAILDPETLTVTLVSRSDNQNRQIKTKVALFNTDGSRIDSN